MANGFSQISAAILRGLFSALVVGKLIDSTCSIWKQQCGRQKHCFIYDMKSYHFLVHILIVVFQIPSILLCIGTCALFRSLAVYGYVRWVCERARVCGRLSKFIKCVIDWRDKHKQTGRPERTGQQEEQRQNRTGRSTGVNIGSKP